MRTLLGRGGNELIFDRRTVTKIASSSQLYKLTQFPSVFVRVNSSREEENGLVSFTMPRLRSPDVVTEGSEALIAGFWLLKQKLWSHRDLFPQPPWREKLWSHLRTVWPRISSVTRLVDSLPEPVQPCAIHGDPTLANLLWDRHRRGWVWCDPIDRDYIPHDPHVDLGKGFQSCWGYERLLLGETDAFAFDESLARDLTRITNLDYEHALWWSFVHLMRLIPYQDSAVALRATEVLHSVGL